MNSDMHINMRIISIILLFGSMFLIHIVEYFFENVHVFTQIVYYILILLIPVIFFLTIRKKNFVIEEVDVENNNEYETDDEAV